MPLPGMHAATGTNSDVKIQIGFTSPGDDVKDLTIGLPPGHADQQRRRHHPGMRRLIQLPLTRLSRRQEGDACRLPDDPDRQVPARSNRGCHQVVHDSAPSYRAPIWWIAVRLEKLQAP